MNSKIQSHHQQKTAFVYLRQPVGYVHDDLGNVTFDPDAQVCHVIQMVFDLFKEKQSAYAVVQYFGRNSIKFPKRSYGGRWKGKLIWGRATVNTSLSRTLKTTGSNLR